MAVFITRREGGGILDKTETTRTQVHRESSSKFDSKKLSSSRQFFFFFLYIPNMQKRINIYLSHKNKPGL